MGALRNRLFERWFSTYERKAQYTFVASSLKDDEGIENYTAIIVRNDNPDLKLVTYGPLDCPEVIEPLMHSKRHL